MPTSSSKKRRRCELEVVKKEPVAEVTKIYDPLPKCDEHSINDCQFWCNDCTLAICMQCADGSHQKHHLQLLRYVLKEKLKESISRLSQFRANENEIMKTVSECDKEIAYYIKCIAAAQSRKKECEQTLRLTDCFRDCLYPIKSFADGKTDSLSEIEAEVLSRVLQILRKLGNQPFKLKSSPFLRVGSMSSLETMVLTGNKCEVSARIVFIEPPLHIFSFSCISASKWPVTATLRLSLLQFVENNSYYSVKVAEKPEVESCVKSHCHMLNAVVFKDITAKKQIVSECDGNIDYFVMELTEY